MLKILPFALPMTMVPVAVLAFTAGGFWSFASGLYSLFLLPIIDHITGLQTKNVDPTTEDRVLFGYRLITWIWVPIQIAVIFSSIAFAGQGHLTSLEYIAATVSLGLLTGGIGITYAHELMHQTNRFERALGEILMTSTLYGHFCIEHVQGHHVHVATENDPVTARFGQSFYAFLPRAVWGSFKSAWSIQKRRMSQKGLPLRHGSNPFWRYLLATVVYVAVAYALAGWVGIVIFISQAVVAIVLLETINYIEHYGLFRTRLPNGRYEHVQLHHSWNASHRITNYFLINLQRHSDHHKHPQRRYPVLQHHDEEKAPQLPFGYPTMLVIALIPPLWFRMMNPRVQDWKKRFYPEERGALPNAS